MKKLKLFIVTAALSAAMSMVVFAGEWKQDSVGWWYQNDDGSYAANVIKQVGGPWYYFDGTGYMKTGSYQLSDGWYTFRDDGSCSNPTDQSGVPVGAPAVGWIEHRDRSANTVQEIADGRVVYYNGLYWSSPDYVNNLKDLAERDVVVRNPTNTLAPGVAVDFGAGKSHGDYEDDEDY